METEIWKDIPNYEGIYKVSSHGRIISIKDKNIIRKQATLKGYKIIDLFKNGVCKMHRVHRLVAQAFIPNPENKPCIDHIDGNRANNMISNLRWVTIKENQNNPVTRKKLSQRKVKPHNEKPILQIKGSKIIARYKSIHDAARKLNITATNICAVCKGREKSYKGFIWAYE